MPEENQVAEVVETTPTETTSEPTMDIEDKWENLDLSAALTSPAEEETPKDDAKSDEETVAPFPSEDEETTDEDETKEETETETVDAAKPRLSRKELRTVEEKVIQPFRDPETSMDEVFQGFVDLHPTRANELATHIVNESVKLYPDQWLQAVLGRDDITVKEVQGILEGNHGVDATPPTSTVPNLSEKPEITNFINELNELYGDAWRDPAKDGELFESDRMAIQLLRQQLQSETANNAELAKTKAELELLRPQVDSIKTAQEAEYEQKVNSTYLSATEEYQNSVMEKTLTQILPEVGLEVSPNDSESVKAMKLYAQDRFKPDTTGISDFEKFVLNGYSEKTNITKIIQRVDKNLSDASRMEVDASRTKDTAKGAELRRNAQSLRVEADREKDRATVLTQNAAKEFLTKDLSPLMKVLEENADLKRRVSTISGRTEIVGQAVAAGGESWRSQLVEDKAKGVDPFDSDILFERLGTIGK